MNNTLLRDSLAELLGTFTLVFLGGLAGSVASQTGSVLSALAHGLALVGIIYAYGHWSGAHVNPAVTAGLLVGGKITLERSIYYWIAQVIGGVLAAVIINIIVVNGAVAAQTIGSLTSTNVGNAAILEFILTFFLVTIVYQAAVYQKVGNVAGIAIGFTLAACIVAGGTFTGGSLNPSRTLGPALIAGNNAGIDLGYVPIYLIAQFLGGVAAGLVHGYVLRPAPEEGVAAKTSSTGSVRGRAASKRR